MDIVIEEWLWNKQSELDERLQLTHVSATEGGGLKEDEWSVWQDAELNVGAKLLVALNPNKPERQRYAVIVAEDNLFPAIRDVIFLHQRYLQTPDELLAAPETLHAKKNPVFSGYLVSCLRSAQYTGNIENEALVLSRLLGHEQLSEAAWGWIRVSLRWRLGESRPVSSPTRNLITESLLNAASSANASLAHNALILILHLSDNKQLDMKPFLNDALRRKIESNYRTLILRNSKPGAHPDFEAQLGLTKID